MSAPASATAVSGTMEEQLAALLALPETETDTAAAVGDKQAFSVASYLNLALSSCNDDNNEEQLQQRMAELALQLQFQTQACHEDIGRIGAELQAVLPRCHADVGRIGVGLQGLQQDALTLLQVTSPNAAAAIAAGAGGSPGGGGESKEQQPQQDEASVSSSLETLSTLHALQANLKRTHEILTAAATWDSTLAEIPPLLAAKDNNATAKDGSSSSMASHLPQAVQKLALLVKGEQALRGMPHPEERTAALQKLRVQISNLLSPQLQHALQNTSSRLGPLQQCVSLYSQLNMVDALVREYVASRPQALHKAWFDFVTNSATAAASATTETSTSALPSSSSSASASMQAFQEWWPTWLESVLLLLQEERRQAAAVFGVGHVPTLLALVLEEAFRPVIPSLTTRLAAAMAAPTSNLDAVCHVYKSLLQFLAVAYESIAGCWLDWMETNPEAAAQPGGGGGPLDTTSDGTSSSSQKIKTIQDGPSLYRQVLDIFQKIASPFAKHQTSLVTLQQTTVQDDFSKLYHMRVREVLPSSITTTPDEKSVDLNDLTRATDGLWQVSQQHLVSTAQDVLNRFECLQGGYGAVAAVEAMDHATQQRLELLTQTLNRLNQSVDWASVFDEPHVLAALQVLKMAATSQSLVQQLQEHTRQRLSVLAERMAAAVARETEVVEAGQDARSAATFVLPDALSPVDVNALLCLKLFGPTEKPEAALTVLQRLGDTSTATTTTTTSLLGQSSTAVAQLGSACHQFVFSACVAVPQKQLQPMAAMASWKDAASADTMDSYGTLPQSYITLVGEHMLALVQALEPFASDAESLKLANKVMKQIRTVAEQPWRDFVTATGVAVGSSGGGDNDATELLIQQLMDSKLMSEYVIGEEAAEEDEEEEEEDADGQDKAVVKFCNAWLDVVGLAVTGRLLERILHIPGLTAKGCEHLTADLGYLQNVLVALGVSGHPHPLLGHVSQVVALDLPSLQERIRYAEKGEPIQAALVAMEERLAAMKSMSSY